MTEYTTTRGPGFGQIVLVLILLLILIVGGVWYYNKTHVVTAGDKVGAAVDAIPSVVSKAADKDNLDKVGDAIKDTGQAASSALSKTGHAASTAVSETSADVKAASDKQKQQNEAH